MSRRRSSEYLIIGSGFGGAFMAYQLAKAGKEVLVVERGVWPVRDDSCWDEEILHPPDPLYQGHTPIVADQNGGSIDKVWPEDMVGGMSPMYGAAAFRLRERDFLGAPREGSEERDPSTAWPFGYAELEPYYAQAERLQHVAGIQNGDLFEPPRSSDFPQALPALPAPSKRVWTAARQLGLTPARIPLAIDFDGKRGNGTCVRCGTCDRYLCRIEAKNDLTVVVLPEAVGYGAEVLADTRVLRINTSAGRATSVDVVNQSSGDRWTIRAKHVVVSAGALGSPYLLLASGIRSQGAGDLMGRFLMRHINRVVAGLLPVRHNPGSEFHKHVVIPDYYEGDPRGRRRPPGPWGIIQEVQIPGRRLLRLRAPRGFKTLAATAGPFLMGLLCMAEDLPQASNRVYPGNGETDRFGQPSMRVFHRYCARDYQAVGALARVARKIVRKARGLPAHTHAVISFSHALGTCRFGKDRNRSVLDPACRVWGYENLYVVDGSFMPAGGSVNPSLTIGANALRVGAILADR